jgi:hypothetical protein
MISDFEGHGLFVVFSGQAVSNGPACRVLGPYRRVSIGGRGVWALGEEHGDPVRLAIRADDGAWEIDGLDEPSWGEMNIVAPDRPTTARAIEAGCDWIRPE